MKLSSLYCKPQGECMQRNPNNSQMNGGEQSQISTSGRNWFCSDVLLGNAGDRSFKVLLVLIRVSVTPDTSIHHHRELKRDACQLMKPESVNEADYHLCAPWEASTSSPNYIVKTHQTFPSPYLLIGYIKHAIETQTFIWDSKKPSMSFFTENCRKLR